MPTFTNPIADRGADPWVIQRADRYYLSESRDGGIWVSMSAAGDLTGVASRPERSVKVFTPPSSGEACAGFWAPELHAVDDRWYIYVAATTCDDDNANHRMFVLESEGSDPLGAYRLAGKVSTPDDHWAIDGTRFEWGGSAYFVWSGWAGDADGQQNLYIAEMSSPTTLSGHRVLLSEPTESWERNAMPIQEGPEALAHGGVLHLIYSASGSWTDDYCYGMLTLLGDPLDPDAWRKSDGPVFERTSTVFGPGHGSFVLSPDGSEPWMVYHSARASGSGWDRVLNAQRFAWDGDAPVFGSPVDPGVPLPVPSGQTAG